MQCQGIYKNKENNQESSGVQQSDFRCDPFSVILEFIPVSGRCGCRGAPGEGGTTRAADPGERTPAASLLRCNSGPRGRGVGRPAVFSLFIPVWADITG